MNLNRILKASMMLACALVQVHATNPEDLSSTTDTDDIVEFTHPTNQQKFHISRNVLESKYPNSMLHLLANPRGAGDMQRSLTLDKTPEGHEQYLPDAVNYINSGGFPVDKDNHSLMAALHYYGVLDAEEAEEYEWSLEYRGHHDALKQKYEDYVNTEIDKVLKKFVPKFLNKFKTVQDYRDMDKKTMCLELHTVQTVARYEEYRNQMIQMGYTISPSSIQFIDSIEIPESLLYKKELFEKRLKARMTRLETIFPRLTWNFSSREYRVINCCPKIQIK